MKKIVLAVAALALLGAIVYFKGEQIEAGPGAGPAAAAQAGSAPARGPGSGVAGAQAWREQAVAGEVKKDSAAQEVADARPGSTPRIDKPATEKDGFIEVKVTSRGTPRAGAQVRLYLHGSIDPNTQAIDWRLAGAGETNRNGIVRLPARPGRYQVAARAEGLAPARHDLVRPLGEPVTHVAVDLQAGASLSGTTVAKGGKEPVPLAAVTLTYFSGGATGPFRMRRPDAPPEEQAHAQSDERGRFRIDGLAPGSYRAEAHAAGYARGIERRVEVPHVGEVALELAGASFISGFVQQADGSPAGGAEVFATGGDQPSAATASSSGSFSVEVNPGTHHLSARLGAQAGALDKPVAVAAGATASGVTIKLGTACSIAGTVVTSSAGAPIPNANIAVSPHGGDGDSGRALSDANGAFSVEGLAPGSYDVVTLADGYSSDERRGVTVLEGQRFPMRIRLVGTGAVEGVVKDSSGMPVENALVTGGVALFGGGGGRFGGGMGGSGGTQPEARTASDGSYRLVGLGAGRAQLSARRDGSSLGADQGADVTEGGTARADFVLQDDGTLSGKVTRKSGGPIEAQTTIRAFRIGGGAMLRIGPGNIASAQVDPSGAYSLTLPVGTYNVMASSGTGGIGMGGPSSRSTAVVEARKVTQKDLVAAEEDDAEEGLTGVVLEPEGAPSAGALVRLSTAGAGGGRGMQMMMPADESGKFAVSRPRADLPDTFDVVATNGGRTGRATVPPSVSKVTIQLQPAASIKGHLVSASGPVNGFTVSVALASGGRFGGGQQLEFTGDRFELSDVPGDTVTLTVRTDDGRTGQASATLTPGSTADVEVQLKDSPTIFGRVSDGLGGPVADAFLNVDGSGMGFNGPTVTSGDGRFKLSNLQPGDHTLRVFAGPMRSTETKFTVAEGQKLDLGDIVLERPKADPGTIGVQLNGNSDGVIISFVLPDGPADKAGLKIGDVLASVDGEPVKGATDARTRVVGPPGTPVTLTVQRNGESKTIPITRAG